MRYVEEIIAGTTIYVLQRSQSRTGKSVVADLKIIVATGGFKPTMVSIAGEVADCYRLPYTRGRGATFKQPVTPESIVRRLGRDRFGEGREDAFIAEWL